MLSIATYVGAIEVRISSGVIERHHYAGKPGIFALDANLGCAWRDQKDWNSTNFPDFLSALPIRLQRITRKRACTALCHRGREPALIPDGLARRHSIRSCDVTIAGCTKVAHATFLCVPV